MQGLCRECIPLFPRTKGKFRVEGLGLECRLGRIIQQLRLGYLGELYMFRASILLVLKGEWGSGWFHNSSLYPYDNLFLSLP